MAIRKQAAQNDLDRLREMEAQARSALASQPTDFSALFLLGSIAVERREFEEAREFFERAVAAQSDSAKALSALAHVHFSMANFEAALAACDRAIAADQSFAPAWVGRGNALSRLGQLDQALASYDSALSHAPADIEALIGRGTALASLGKGEEAIAALRRIPPGPGSVNIFRRASLFASLGLFEAAAADYRRWIKVTSQPLPGWVGLAQCASETCDWKALEEPRRKLGEALEAGQPVPPHIVLALSSDPAQHLKAARASAPRVLEMISAAPRPVSRPARLRIAYLSPDFRVHPLAYLIAEMLEKHDRSRFEIVCVSLGPDDRSDIRARIEHAADRFCDFGTSPNDHAVGTLRALEPDIAVDLAGYTLHARPEILARRVALLQASYLGYCGTSGGTFIDYLVADRIAVPPEEQDFFTEKLVYLPDTFMVADSGQPIAEKPASRAEAGLPDDGFVFCCFNKNYKLTPEMFDAWMRVLQAVEGSVLWLAGNRGYGKDNLRRNAQTRGVDPDRLIFAPALSSRAEHFARHRFAGLFLDTQPYNAHTTAVDALYSGLPVLTMRGPTFVGRVAASALHAIGLDELIARDLSDYEESAIDLARNPGRLAALREKLAANHATRPLFQTERFCRNLERAYDRMFEIYRAGESPRSFDVP